MQKYLLMIRSLEEVLEVTLNQHDAVVAPPKDLASSPLEKSDLQFEEEELDESEAVEYEAEVDEIQEPSPDEVCHATALPSLV